jgi:hypothetical protein
MEGPALHSLADQDADRGEHGDPPVRQLRLAGRGRRRGCNSIYVKPETERLED